MKAPEQTIITIATACPCTPVTVFTGDPNALSGGAMIQLKNMVVTDKSIETGDKCPKCGESPEVSEDTYSALGGHVVTLECKSCKLIGNVGGTSWFDRSDLGVQAQFAEAKELEKARRGHTD